jgi:2-dehydro-3-deoxy-phosphogluconate aldolase
MDGLTAIQRMRKWRNTTLFNFLAADIEDVQTIVKLTNGYVVPGIVVSNFTNTEEAILKVKELQTVTDVISIGLGDNGNVGNFSKVLSVAKHCNNIHINQPIETAGFAKALHPSVYVNALVRPSGKIGYVKAIGNELYKIEDVVDICLESNISSIKFMSIEGEKYLDECAFVSEVAAKKGIYGIEPAGGIHSGNIMNITDTILATGISFFMPHIFGSVLDKHTGKIIPAEVEKLLQAIGF